MERLIDEQQFEELMEFEMKEAERDYEMSLQRQVGGKHYMVHKIQPWHIIDEYNLNYYEGNALKYLLRVKDNREEDLEKCIHYLERELDNERERKLDECNRTDTTV